MAKLSLTVLRGIPPATSSKSVRYIRLPELLEELVLAQDDWEFSKTLKMYRKYDLLILDE